MQYINDVDDHKVVAHKQFVELINCLVMHLSHFLKRKMENTLVVFSMSTCSGSTAFHVFLFCLEFCKDLLQRFIKVPSAFKKKISMTKDAIIVMHCYLFEIFPAAILAHFYSVSS